jgi:RNA polymerase primary sigma factor
MDAPTLEGYAMSSAAEVPALELSERYEHALSLGRAVGRIPSSLIDELIRSDEFEREEFDRFLGEAQACDIPIDWGTPRPPGFSPSLPAEVECDPFDLYCREIGRVRLLTAREEVALGLAVQRGDDGARRRVILGNLRLVVKMAAAYRNRGLPVLDLIAEGNLGLIAAVDRFDPRRGFRFSTYASWWIRQAISRAVVRQGSCVRLPLHVVQRLRRMQRADRRLTNELGRSPYLDELAQALGRPSAEVERDQSALCAIASLDGADRQTIEKHFSPEAGPEAPSPADLVEGQLETERLSRLLARLGGKEEAVLRIRYGFHDGEEHTLAETGRVLGVSRERTRQIERRALGKLKALLV